jgi:hypothetical protein
MHAKVRPAATTHVYEQLLSEALTEQLEQKTKELLPKDTEKKNQQTKNNTTLFSFSLVFCSSWQFRVWL